MGIDGDTGGAAGSSSGFSAPPADLASTGAGLTGIASTVAGKRGYGAVGGTGDYGVVASAVAERVSAWNPALDSWQASLTSLGDAVAQSGTAISDTDAAMSRAWSSLDPGGRP